MVFIDSMALFSGSVPTSCDKVTLKVKDLNWNLDINDFIICIYVYATLTRLNIFYEQRAA